MKYRFYKTLTIALILFLSCLACSNKNEEFKNESEDSFLKTGIIVNNNSAIRIQPMRLSSPIITLNKGAKIKIIEKSGEKSYIAKKSEFWYKIYTKSGIQGWTFGTNLRQFSNNDYDAINSFSNKLKNEEIQKVFKELKGKWWSINNWGHFTNFSISIFKNGDYISLKKGNSNEIKGSVIIDPDKSGIKFNSKTHVGSDFTYFSMGGELFIECKKKKYSIKFKRISRNPETKNLAL